MIKQKGAKVKQVPKICDWFLDKGFLGRNGEKFKRKS